MELIVVIAILGILAGIAIPVYSGYMTKANQAADNQLLAAVNTAFASACAETGLGTNDVTNAFLTIKNKCITGVRPTVSDDAAARALAAKPDANGVVAAPLGARALSAADVSVRIGDAFVRYFAGNTATELKYYEGAGNFAFENGVFVGYDNGADRTFMYTKDDKTYSFSISTDDLNAYGNSTFSTDMKISDLMGNVNDLVLTAGVISDESLASVFTEDELNALGLSKDASGKYTTESKTKLANALVLKVAQNSGDLKTDDILESVKNGSLLSEMIYNDFGSDYTGLATKASVMYALAAAYANSNGSDEITIIGDDNQSRTTTIGEYYNEVTNELKNSTGGSAALASVAGMVYNMMYTLDESAMENIDEEGFEESNLYVMTDSFKAYLENSGESDLNGYISAMNIINNNAGQLVKDKLLTNGFADQDLIEMVTYVLG